MPTAQAPSRYISPATIGPLEKAEIKRRAVEFKRQSENEKRIKIGPTRTLKPKKESLKLDTSGPPSPKMRDYIRNFYKELDRSEKKQKFKVIGRNAPGRRSTKNPLKPHKLTENTIIHDLISDNLINTDIYPPSAGYERKSNN